MLERGVIVCLGTDSLASNPDLRDKLALRLLLDYGLRKGALQGVQFKHFDHYRKRLTVFTKGREDPRPPNPPPRLLERPREAHHRRAGSTDRPPPPSPQGDPAGQLRDGDSPVPGEADGCPRLTQLVVRVSAASRSRFRGRHLQRADAQGPPHGGQRVLDATGNLKAVQKLLGHESISTTGDVYTDWDVEQLAESLLEAVQDDEVAIVPQGASGNPHG